MFYARRTGGGPNFPLKIWVGGLLVVDEAEQKAIADLLRTVRIAIVVMAAVGGGLGLNEMMGVI